MTNQKYSEFYRQLGKVFYGIAAADRIVRKEENEALRKIVKDHWLALEESIDEFGDDLAYQIEMSFDWFLENGTDQSVILQDFKVYKEAHATLFNAKIKNLIVKTANAIASSFSGKNKSELIFISQLESILAG